MQESNIIQLKCAVSYCVSHRHVKSKSTLCVSHLSLAILHILRAQDPYSGISYKKIADSLVKEKVSDLVEANIKRIASVLLKQEDKVIRKYFSDKYAIYNDDFADIKGT